MYLYLDDGDRYLQINEEWVQRLERKCNVTEEHRMLFDELVQLKREVARGEDEIAEL